VPMTANGLAKLLEELGELAQVAAKRLAYFHTAIHPDGAGDLNERMEAEMGDVLGAIGFVVERFALNADRIDLRALEKRRLFGKWHADPDNGRDCFHADARGIGVRSTTTEGRGPEGVEPGPKDAPNPKGEDREAAPALPTQAPPRFFIDHGVIHDRLTGRHVHGNRDFPPHEADEAVAMLNNLHERATQAQPASPELTQALNALLAYLQETIDTNSRDRDDWRDDTHYAIKALKNCIAASKDRS